MDKMQLLACWVREIQISPEKAVRLVSSAPYQYKHYTIPKRSGGVRHIYHPSRELKAVQRWLVGNIFSKLPVHDSVYSYREGVNIQRHAQAHIESNYSLRFDFRDFFPSLSYSWVVSYLRDEVNNNHISLTDDAIDMVARIVCRRDRATSQLALSIGAPSSPILSNAMLFNLDYHVDQMARDFDVRYTRYADDIYFSARRPNILKDVEKEFRNRLYQLAPLLKINEEKTRRKSRKTRRIVTGMVLTPMHQVSIGRHRKRAIRTQVFLFSKSELSKEDASSLAGMISFASDVEPEFVLRLRQKYGDQIINNLISHGFGSNRP